jgi:hypothetical protein
LKKEGKKRMKELLEEMVMDLKEVKKIADKKERKFGRLWGFASALTIFFTIFNIAIANYFWIPVNIFGLLCCFVGITRYRQNIIRPRNTLQECIKQIEKDIEELVEQENDSKCAKTQ